MSEYSSLTQDEREFIQQLFTPPAGGKPAHALRFRVDGGEHGNALLSLLAENAHLSLQSHFKDHWISFPLQLVEDEFHTLYMHLGVPRIVEDGPVLRPWRLHLKQAIALQDANGQQSRLLVQELSPKGLVLSSSGKAPLHFSLWLPLPGQEPILLRGTRVRSVNKNVAAYQLEGETERIRQFIFQQHGLADLKPDGGPQELEPG